MKPSRETLRTAALSVVFILIVAAATGFNWLRALWILLGLVALFFALFGLLIVPIAWWNKRRDRPSAHYIDRLDIDDRRITYTATPTSKTLAWDEMTRVQFYFGAPDFADSIVGMAPVREWRLFSKADSLYIPDMYGYSARLGEWCGKKLTGFSAVALQNALISKDETTWTLWERDR